MKKILALTLAAVLLAGCGDPEEKARALYNKALVEQRAGNIEEAKEAYNKIVEKYPSTEIAVKVNESLAAQQVVSEAATEVKKEIIKQTITQALHLYRLDNGRYPTTEQGLEALIEQPTIDPVPLRWREDGYLNKREDLLLVEDYTSEERGSFDIVMR
jgi:general secretion pathway protein G